MKHFKTFNPTKSFIRVDISTENPSVQTCPCKEKLCIKSCPTKAISISKMGRIVIDKEKCIKCGKCVEVCPYNIMKFVDEFPMGCDLCDGSPECVKYCTLGAIKVK